MSTAQGPAPRTRPGDAVATAARTVTSSYLVQFLVFVALLVAVVVLLSRQPEGGPQRAQIVLLALAGTLALVGTVLQLASGRSTPEGVDSAASGTRTGPALIGAGVVLVAAAGLVGFW